MREVELSIVIPVYNGEKYIARCLKSIQSQSFTNLEVIVVDDGSIDTTLEICKEFSKGDPRIKVFSKENQGVSNSRNYGIVQANGNFITFVDADDWITSDFSEVIIKNASDDVDVILCDYYITDGISKERQYQFKEQGVLNATILKRSLSFANYEDVYSQNILNGAPWARAFRADILKNNLIRFPEEIYHSEDRIFNLLVYNNIEKAKYVATPVYYYYKHNGSVTAGLEKSDGKRLLKNFNVYLSYIKKVYIDDVEVNERDTDAIFNEVCHVLKHVMWYAESEQDKKMRKRAMEECTKWINIVEQIPFHASIINKVMFLFGKYKCYNLLYILIFLKKKWQKFTTKK